MGTFGPVAFNIWTLQILVLGLPVFKAHNRIFNHDSKAYGNQQDNWCFT